VLHRKLKPDQVKDLVLYLSDKGVARFKGLDLEIDFYNAAQMDPVMKMMDEQKPELSDSELRNFYESRRV
tara:strand:- start:286 stop:495 length:210 start_codon:yes stop_codon:yes gene_type:complete